MILLSLRNPLQSLFSAEYRPREIGAQGFAPLAVLGSVPVLQLLLERTKKGTREMCREEQTENHRHTLAWVGRDLKVQAPGFYQENNRQLKVLGVQLWRERRDRHRGRGWFSPGLGWALFPVPAVPVT